MRTARLHKERNECDVGDVAAVDGATLVARMEADSVVGGDDEERAVPESRDPEPMRDVAENAIDVTDLKEMPLVAAIDLARL